MCPWHHTTVIDFTPTLPLDNGIAASSLASHQPFFLTMESHHSGRPHTDALYDDGITPPPVHSPAASHRWVCTFTTPLTGVLARRLHKEPWTCPKHVRGHDHDLYHTLILRRVLSIVSCLPLCMGQQQVPLINITTSLEQITCNHFF